MILGCDPGLSGAFCLLDPKTGIKQLFDMPIKKDRTKRARNWVDETELAFWVSTYTPLIRYAVIEDVSAMPKQGVAGMFRFGLATGVVRGTLAACMVRTHLVKPAVWKSGLGLPGSKSAALAKAKEIFPTEHFPHDGQAEAALIAYWGLKLWGVA